MADWTAERARSRSPSSSHWMAVAPSGEAHVAWLDLRSRDQAGQDIYYAKLVDGKVGQNRKVASTVCECCRPGLAVGAVPPGGAPSSAVARVRPSRPAFDAE